MERRLVLVLGLCALTACVDGSPPDKTPLPLSRLRVDRTYLRDDAGRYVFFHGVNASCTSKVPITVDPSGIVTYVGRPFPVDAAPAEFARIRDAGFNAVRLLVMWEGVEPERGQYNTDYLNYLRRMVQIAGDHGLYVLLDMHQDLFSRHLLAKYNDRPDPNAATPGTAEYQLLALVPSLINGYTAAVQGDGAPRWAVEACLQEKRMDSPFWGTPRILSGLGQTELDQIVALWQRITGAPSDPNAPVPPWALAFAAALPGKFDVDESTDFLPFTDWGLAGAISIDIARCYACLFAGEAAFPNLKVGDQSVQEYLQSAYADAWVKVAEQMTDLPNVMGYDLINEPESNFIVLTAVAGMISAGVVDGAKNALVSLLGTQNGGDVYDALVTLRILPPDTQPATLAKWGLSELNVTNLFGLNYGFDENYLRPFYERMARAVLAVDPKALFFIESSANLSVVTGSGGVGGIWDITMTHPAGDDLADKVVYSPHWYADIYPFPGFDVNPRQFTEDQVRYRDYRPDLEKQAALAQSSLGNIPVVFGEFGSYFNFNNTIEDGQYVDRAAQDNYAVTAAFLNNYYEAFESMFASRILWCYSTENEAEKGDLWNHEDFSVLGPDQELRAQAAWSRPHARALAGKPISTHFYSDLHYFDPDKGIPDPLHEFEVHYASKETEAPSEIVVPASQYPDGFYVWISDGVCSFDPDTSILYHHPQLDDPGVEHWLRIRPPEPGQENVDWNYFFRGHTMAGGL